MLHTHHADIGTSLRYTMVHPAVPTVATICVEGPLPGRQAEWLAVSSEPDGGVSLRLSSRG